MFESRHYKEQDEHFKSRQESTKQTISSDRQNNYQNIMLQQQVHKNHFNLATDDFTNPVKDKFTLRQEEDALYHERTR